MDGGTSAIAVRVSGAIEQFSLPQNRTLNYEDWYNELENHSE
jgi:hypothetical protein